MTEIVALPPLTELPPHWADEILNETRLRYSDDWPAFDAIKITGDQFLALINALIASGKASVELHSETFGDVHDVTSTRRLVIDLE